MSCVPFVVADLLRVFALLIARKLLLLTGHDVRVPLEGTINTQQWEESWVLSVHK